MTKRTFKVRVKRTDVYEIEIDESVMNEEWAEDFRSFFYDFHDAKEHAEHVAQLRARFHSGNLYGGFMEGYGDVALNGKVNPNSRAPFPALNISRKNEDNMLIIDTEEITK